MQHSSQQEFERLSADIGIFELVDWSLVRILGSDRCRFLNSFCTADILAMSEGEVREAFILNGKGKTLGHVQVLVLPDSLLLVGAGDQAAALMQHLDMYIIREDVQLEDGSAANSSFLVVGEPAEQKLAERFGTVPGSGKCQRVSCEGVGELVLAAAEFAGPCYWLSAPSIEKRELLGIFEAASWPKVSADVIEMVRLSHGTPWFGRETTAENLPQELNRDDKTISFTKGCYLGQETVARIDSLGRVNQLLVTLDFGEKEPTAGQALLQGDKTVGRVTSIARSGDGKGWTALAFVKRELAAVGSEVGPARVVA